MFAGSVLRREENPRFATTISPNEHYQEASGRPHEKSGLVMPKLVSPRLLLSVGRPRVRAQPALVGELGMCLRGLERPGGLVAERCSLHAKFSDQHHGSQRAAERIHAPANFDDGPR